MTGDTEKFWVILADMTVCMVTTRDGDVLRSRPMAPYIDAEKRTIRFMTDSDSAKLIELSDNSDMALNFADQKKMIFVSVSAKGVISRDRDLIKDMWGPYAEVFFGSDPETADVAIIKAVPVQAEYWDNSGGMLKLAAEMTRAYFSDDGPNLGENAKLDL